MNFAVHIPFVELLGFELLKVDNSEAEIRFSPRLEHDNSFGVVHGGAIMTLMDVAMAHAARANDDPRGVVTIEMKTSFIKGGIGPLLAKGSVLKRTASLAFTEAKVYDDSGDLVAHSTGTFKYMKRIVPGSGREGAASTVPTD